jgi:four helix bundle protein
MSEEFGYQRLIAWQKADLLANKTYQYTINFPASEIYGLTSQIRRAVLSVPTNIVEGFARNSKKEFCRFLNISLASLAETEYLLGFAFKQKFIKDKEYLELINLRQECGKYIWKLMQSQK